ncbi:aldehyde dehydrogenase family protein [Sulfurospirillum oryzae]|uniref:aldehyde dehydrogenase family protein n=1 Tax=Sulfurospirillum oryzae TaxID=2976535 RepID=UPI0021E7AA12|nr:aldehyde dehydrogenase family protein [Sulfurospirillum oryzae]
MKANLYYGSTCKDKEQQKEVRSPFDGRVVSTFSLCDEMDAIEVLNIAQKAALHVKLTPLYQRMNWLLDVAQKLEGEREKIAHIITDEVGKPITFSRVEVDRCIETIKLSANAMLHVNGETFDTTAMPSGKKSLAFYKREPVGVVLAITPFNFPLNLVAHKIAPALVAGNAVILKPTSQAPRTAYELVKLFIESPYAPKDALSLIYSGEGVNEALITNDIPRVISFTGSVSVGREIMQKAGIKKVALELGGNAATYIDVSANIALAAKRCAVGAFINSGQVCISLQRIYVHESVYESFEKALVEETKSLHVGSPYDDQTFIGPMVNEDAVKKAKRWIQSAIDEGAKPLCGFTCNGLLFAPTIMADVTEAMAIVCEEVFAPIVSLIKVRGYEEAKEKMNTSDYGLQYSIFCSDLAMAQRAIDELEAGGIVINDIPTLRFDLQPYGGIKQSGVGKEGPYFALMDDYTQVKSVVIC